LVIESQDNLICVASFIYLARLNRICSSTDFSSDINLNMLANNASNGYVLSIATGEAITFENISISTYTRLYFVTINKKTYIIVNLKKT